nr:hypothetical protein [Methylobacterium sp. ZNC0032]
MTDEERARLAQLEATRDRIISGDQASSVLVTPNGHKTDFVRPDIGRLERRLDELKAKEEGRPVRGAIGLTF